MTQSLLRSPKTFTEAGAISLLKPIRAFLTEKVDGSGARILTLMSMCVLLGSVFIAQETPAAFAVQVKPATVWSYYVNSNSTSTAYTLGCNQGKADATNHAALNQRSGSDLRSSNPSIWPTSVGVPFIIPCTPYLDAAGQMTSNKRVLQLILAIRSAPGWECVCLSGYHAENRKGSTFYGYTKNS